MVGLPCGLLQGDTAGGGRGNALQPGSVSEPQSSSAQPLLLPCNLPMVSGVWMVIGLLSPSCSGAHSINVTHGQMFLFLGKNNL